MSTPRLFGGASAGNPVSAFQLIYDPNQVSTEGSQTGMWRPLQAGDFSNITISGVEVVVGSIAVTGSPNVTVANPVVPVSGVVTPVATTYTSFVTGIIGTGQIAVPAAAKRWDLYVISGAVWAKGFGPLLPTASLHGGNYDASSTSASSFGIGGTGAGATAVNVIVTWDT